MARLLVLVEGQTEENFVNEVLAPYLYDRGYTSVNASLLGNARQRIKRGSIKRWDSARKDILNQLKQDQEIVVTTIVDYYRLPVSWPGRSEAPQLAFQGRAASVQQKLLDDVIADLGDSFDLRRFVPYIVMHEFEGLLFSDAEGLGRGASRADLSSDFQAIRDEFATPEEINDSPETAPSKRIKDLFPGYQKPLHGVLAVKEIGLEAIRRECRLFSGWIDELEQRAA